MQRYLLLLAALCISLPAFAQPLVLPALSPSSTLTQSFSTSKIEISYSRPSMRGRKVFGELVPFGKVWRTGANAATKITFEETMVIGGSTIAPGTYSFYTVPGESEWEIILNKNTGNWGAYGYSKADDVARFVVKPTKLSAPVETFTISITDITFSSCNIELQWENTRVVVPVVCNNAERLATAIDKAVNNPSIPYQQAATYFNEANQHLDKALEYVSKAIEQNPKAYWNFMLKARIAAKLGKKDVAKAAAEQAMNAAKGTDAEGEYAAMAKALIESL